MQILFDEAQNATNKIDCHGSNCIFPLFFGVLATNSMVRTTTRKKFILI